jgi:hypothetical protein
MVSKIFLPGRMKCKNAKICFYNILNTLHVKFCWHIQVVGLNIDKTLNMKPPQIPKVVSLTDIMNEEREKENEKRELVRKFVLYLHPCFISSAITLTEAICCCKFGLELFKQTSVAYIILWLCIH